jgi:hypothetical protein
LIEAEMARLAAKRERAAAREARRIEQDRRNAPKIMASLEALSAAIRAEMGSETPSDGGHPVDDPEHGQ